MSSNSAFEEDSNSPEDKEVDDLDGAEEADAHAEAEEAPDVGQQLQPREPLLPLLLHEVQLLEVDVHVRHVVDDVRVVLVLGVLLCKDKDIMYNALCYLSINLLRQLNDGTELN